jgi:hypothetical protein
MIIVPYLRWRTFIYWAVEPLMCETCFESHWGMGWHKISSDFNPNQSQQLSSSLSKLPVVFKIHSQCKLQARIIYVLCHGTFTNVRNQNRFKKKSGSGLFGHHIFSLKRICVLKRKCDWVLDEKVEKGNAQRLY